MPQEGFAMKNDKQVIQMVPKKTDTGEIHYAMRKDSGSAPQPPAWLLRMGGIALGAAFFLFIVFFFVYVLLPIILLVVLWAVLRSLFRTRR